ncbi:MAG: undecaprenyl-diphosphate phosphatase [Myxococcales bacterium]|nr:undecaprenyl-diphosphate phosphatase [Polyangiaceae bacterium]MDW8249555.1 undecaprenyl-diphosphate phosphatase [Myxococcales bacterium]
MHLWQAALLGLIEGLTEFLPVSSTGHLILAGHLLGLGGEGAHAFEIVIQLGALLAVVVHYRQLLRAHLSGLLRREPRSLDLALALLVAFAPVAIVGLGLRKVIKYFLFGPAPVAAALVLGGFLMLALPRLLCGRERLEGLDHVTPRRALWIGMGQCLSLWPGASRAMCTMMAAEIAGLSTATAAEFSFLLALPTLGAATAYEALKSWKLLLATVSLPAMAIGLLTSFFVAWAVIAGFLRYLAHAGLAPFGIYRIFLGGTVFILLVRGSL